MRPSSANSRSEAASVRLEPLELWLEPVPGPLRPQILAALRPYGEPLRWAITAVEPNSSATLAIDGCQEPSAAAAFDAVVAGERSRPQAGGEVGPGPSFGLGASDGPDPADQRGDGPGRLRLEAVMLR
jgi:hypothetical protein